MKRTPLLAALLISAASAGWADTADIRSVILFEAGLAEIGRATGASTEVTLRVPRRDVNDVLKSLILLGTGIEGGSILLDGSSPVEDAFLDSAVQPEAIGDLEALLSSIPGTRIKVSAEGNEIIGEIMGVTRSADCDEDGACTVHIALRDEVGVITRQVLAGNVDVTILDDGVNRSIERGLDAMQAASGSGARDITLRIDAAPDAAGALSYVIAAPAWKTAYRAITDPSGRVDLQAWAVIENATPEDWSDVSLTLSSGSPNVLASDLQARRWPSRESYNPEPPKAQKAAAFMNLDAFAQGDASAEISMARGAMEMAPVPAAISAGASAGEGTADSRFTFPDAIDLPAGKMISVPFLSDPLEARHVSLYRGQLRDRIGYPDLILDLTNDLSVRLPAGIMTVHETGTGYIGDAAFPLLAPGESAMVRFGEDRKVRVEETVTGERRQRSARVSAGALIIIDEEVRETSYVVSSPAGEDRALLLEHPEIDGWEARVLQGPEDFTTEMSADGIKARQFEIAVSPGAESILRIEEILPVQETYMIAEFSPETLLSFTSRKMSDEDRVFLEAAAALMEARLLIEREIDEMTRARERLIQDQSRISGLLSSFPENSSQVEEYRVDMVRMETEIRALDDRDRAARLELVDAQRALRDHIASR